MTSYSAPSSYQPEDASRSTSRAAVSIFCEVRQGTRPWQQVWLKDLSPSGFRITNLANPTTVQPVSIRIPGMQLLSAQIRWQSGVLVGCEFVAPLHVAVFDHLVRQARSF